MKIKKPVRKQRKRTKGWRMEPKSSGEREMPHNCLEKIFCDKSVLRSLSSRSFLPRNPVVLIPPQKIIRDRNDKFCHTGACYYLQENHPPQGYELLSTGLNEDVDW